MGSCANSLFDELEHGLEVLRHSNWSTLHRLAQSSSVILAHKCFYGQMPKDLIALFEKNDLKYNLRLRRKVTFVLLRPKTDYLKRSITLKAVSLRNSMDNETRITIMT
jgi:hypothetical protein